MTEPAWWWREGEGMAVWPAASRVGGATFAIGMGGTS
jgi:hypothetical protein